MQELYLFTEQWKIIYTQLTICWGNYSISFGDKLAKMCIVETAVYIWPQNKLYVAPVWYHERNSGIIGA